MRRVLLSFHRCTSISKESWGWGPYFSFATTTGHARFASTTSVGVVADAATRCRIASFPPNLWPDFTVMFLVQSAVIVIQFCVLFSLIFSFLFVLFLSIIAGGVGLASWVLT